jgi:hypothetical protein
VRAQEKVDGCGGGDGDGWFRRTRVVFSGVLGLDKNLEEEEGGCGLKTLVGKN